MMIEELCAYVENTDIAMTISASGWLFPAIESIHVMALGLTFGSICMVDLRLLRVIFPDKDVRLVTTEILPWTWAAFLVAAVTGALMFVSAATKYIHLWAFQLKIALLLAAGLNMLIFNLFTVRDARWAAHSAPPPAARLAGGISLTLWVGIVSAGRIIGFL